MKCHYVSMHGGGRDAARLHLAYLERDGVERDGSPGHLYGADEAFDKAGFAEPLKGEKRQFRFIVSPEDGRDVHLQAFTRELMVQVEKDLGRSLIWTAVNHHNTDHPHVHVVVRGVDRNGKEVRFPRAYIKEDMQSRAAQIMTRELGVRTELDIDQQRSNEIGQERLTSIDRRLARLVTEDGRLLAPAIAKLHPQERSTVLARLGTLAALGLACSGPRGAWELAGKWTDSLVKSGLRNDVIKHLHQVAGGDVARYRFVAPSELSALIEARQLAGLHPGLDTRAAGRGYIVLAPSRHPSGRRYTWTSTIEPAKAPGWLVEIVRVVAAPYLPAPLSPVATNRRQRYERAVLAGEARAVAETAEGARNARLFRAWKRCAEFRDVLDRTAAERELTAAGLAAGLPEPEIRRVLR